jgi:hypothetical protein
MVVSLVARVVVDRREIIPCPFSGEADMPWCGFDRLRGD